MRASLRRLLGFAVVVSAVSCSPDTANGTALFIDVTWSGNDAIVQLRFSGTQGAAMAFPESLRPTTAGAALSSPQSVRVLLSDDLGGQSVDVSVEGLNASAAVIAHGTQSASVVTGHETTVNIDLTDGSGAGGGTAGTGGGAVGVGGGTAGTGGGTVGTGGGNSMNGDGGVPCNCTTGCCLPGTKTCAIGTVIYPQSVLPYEVLICSATDKCSEPDTSNSCGAKTVCVAPPPGPECTTLRANSCSPEGCRCGNGPACGDGLQCLLGSCFCSASSNCHGCCSADAGSCEVGTENRFCGSAGESCDNCLIIDAGIAGLGCGIGSVCNGIKKPTCNGNQCATGDHCVPAEFPRCSGAAGACISCDLERTDSCISAGGGTTQCVCSGSGHACAANEVCAHPTMMSAGMCKPLYSSAP